ncbi:MAG: DNA polymerase III subunit alpha [Planctomycetes bacterium]|jgi:DNA polymerase-3 subunit alpha|nr:DNA polymerase III subunit alpha [Planctomycetota bacterium]
MEPFVHLHVHTEYSLLDGANRIDRLVDAAVEDGHKSLAITDHGNLFGAIEFYKACKARDIKPILGCEAYVALGSMHEKHHRQDNPYTHLTLLARDLEGWHNLMRMTSASYLDGFSFRPRVDFDFLSRHAKGLTCLSGCMSGPVNRMLRRDDKAGAVQMAGKLQDMFGREHFYLEVMRNGIKEQDNLTDAMKVLQPTIEAPLVATNDIHYLRHEDCATQDAMLCLAQGAKLNDENRWKFDTDSLFFRTQSDMNRVFSDLPEALRTTLDVAEQVDVEIELGNHRLPHFDSDDGTPPDELFRKLCEEGFAARYPGNPTEPRERMEFEMKVISKMGFTSYFLIVWDLIRYAHEQGIPVGPGRGSAAGSIVAYCMNITRIDPIKYDLIFERFLNPDRVSMPDIDIDFCKDRREEMILYTRKRYGDENVCQIITFGKLKAKNALRDTGRIMDIPLNVVDRVAKKIPDTLGITLSEALDQGAELAAERDATDESKKWFDLALSVEGLSRNAGVHAAGVIIADEPLRDIVPLAKFNDNTVTQWDMNVCEAYGLLKMDFLGLRTLSILNEGVKLVKKVKGLDIDLDAISLEDEAVFSLLQKADTEGIFQLESGGMRNLLAQLKPSCYEDVIAVLALFRPGPLGSGLHEMYARRKHGLEAVVYPHPILEDILKETYGLLIYQEQIMRVSQVMGGFTLAQADSLRKAMGKKIIKMMEAFQGQFISGALERDVPESVAESVWKTMLEFAKYGFNKSHSAGYAMVTFQAAWLKAHHPEAFYAASCTYEAADSKKLAILIEDSRRHGISVLPPCINESNAKFTVLDEKRIRFGLEAIKGVGTGAAEAVVKSREGQDDGVFPSIMECFIAGVAEGVNKSTYECLTKGGAFDSFAQRRVDLLPTIEDKVRDAAGKAKDRASGQASLFDMLSGTGPGISESSGGDGSNELELRKLTKDELRLTLTMEKEVLGLYLSRHPLDPYRALLGGISRHNSANMHETSDESMVTLAGIISQCTIRGTRKDPNRKFAKFRIEDLFGSTGAVVFPRDLERLRDSVEEDFIGIFTGRVSINRDEPELLVEDIKPMKDRDNMQLKGYLQVRLTADSPPLQELGAVLQKHKGNAMVRFIYQDPQGKKHVVRAGSSWKVRLRTELVDELNQLLGTGSAFVRMDPSTSQNSDDGGRKRRRFTKKSSG